MSLRIRLHEGVTARSLALARVVVFAIWIVFVVQDPLHDLVFLPFELFHTYGVFEFVPDSFWQAILTPAGLLGLKAVAILVFGWALLGFRGARWMTAFAVVVGMVYLQVRKGFGGHWDHRELTLVYVTAALVLTPAWDAFAAHRTNGVRRDDIYRASLLVLSFVVIVQYVFIGAARTFIGAPGVFLDGTLQNWVENRNLRPNPFGFDIGTYFLDPFWAVPLDLLFLGGTILELASIVLLFLRPGWIKVGFVIGFAVFHMAIFLMMNVAFPENIALLVLFFDLDAPLRRMRAGRSGAGAATFDPGNPRAELLARAGRAAEAREAYDAAAALCTNTAERGHLLARRDLLGTDHDGAPVGDVTRGRAPAAP